MNQTILDAATNAASVGLKDADLHLIIPDRGLTAQSLSELLRGLETLLAIRAMASLDSEELKEAKKGYSKFLVEYSLEVDSNKLRRTADFILPDFLQARSDFFSIYLSRLAEEGVSGSLELISIEKGSFEFLFHSANLFAVFGLQSHWLLKDCVQWACSVIASLINGQSKDPIVVAGWRLELAFTPELVNAQSNMSLST